MTTQPSPRARRFILAVDRVVVFITQYWIALAVTFLLLFSGLPALAPILMRAGITAPAELIYRVYSLTCHQLAYRSFFFFGAQPAYTIGELQHALGVTNDAADAFFWRAAIGDAHIGYKMAWCERDAAIYAAMILTFILLGLFPRVVPRLDWRVYIFVFVLPMAFDGAWQLVTSPIHILPFLPVHESTALERTIAGALFGIGSVWLVFPYLADAMRDAHKDARYQYARAQERSENTASDFQLR
ncbi:MAG: DUF2085 domain-containing protein [Chloroflexi bacterium]|nr:DUF2085 domain-containing protein [Chloroflexota bacterium]